MSKPNMARLAGRETGRRATSGSKPKTVRATAAIDPEQLSHEDLAAENPTAEMPDMVRNGRMAVNYVKPHFDIDKDKRTVALEFSLELTEAHRGVLPLRIHDAWEDLVARGYPRIDVAGISAQKVDIRLAPDDKESDLAGDAIIESVSLATIEDKGTGDAKNVVRLKFRVGFDLTQTVERFACRNFGNTVWLKMVALQGELL